jgi:hypothetical protein
MTLKELEARERNWDLKSLLLPIVLMVAGTLVLAGADIGMVSLDRIQNLWPAAIILVGLTELLSERSQERGQRE